MQDEKEIIQQCLTICAQVSDYVEGARRTSLTDIAPLSDAFSSISSLTSPCMPWLITAEAFNSTQKGFTSSKLQLLQYLHSINKELQTGQYRLPPPQETQMNEQRELQEEVESTEETLAICDRASNQENEARRNIYENISAGDESHQVIASLKDLISAKNVKVGSKSFQAMGQFVPGDLQFLSRRHNGSVNDENK